MSQNFDLAEKKNNLNNVCKRKNELILGVARAISTAAPVALQV